MSRAIRKLLAEQLITREQFERATLLQSRHGKTIGYHLVNLGALDDDELVRFFVDKFSFDHWPRSRLRDLNPRVISRIPREMAVDLRVLPLELNGLTLTLGLTDPTRSHVAEEVAFQTGCEIVPVVISEIDMTWALDNYYLTAPLESEIEKGDFETEPLEDVPLEDSKVPTLWSEEPVISMRLAIKIGPSENPEPLLLDNMRPQAEPGSKTDRLGEGQIIAAIHKAPSRDAIVDLALKYLMLFSHRAAFFVVKKDKIAGFEIVGNMTSRSAIRSYWVPLSSESTMRQVVTERRIHLGPLGRTAADAILAAALGGRPRRILAIPVQISGRVVGILYSDQFKVDMPPWNRIERLAEVVGDNLKRLLLNKDN
jgi:hypothetical protein